MFAKLFTIATLAIAVLATEPEGPVVTTVNSCNVNQQYCCQSVQKASTEASQKALSLVGVIVSDVTAQIGLSCSQIDVLAIGGNACSAQPTCCTGTNHKEIAAINCSPINVNA